MAPPTNTQLSRLESRIAALELEARTSGIWDGYQFEWMDAVAAHIDALELYLEISLKEESPKVKREVEKLKKAQTRVTAALKKLGAKPPKARR